MRFVLAAALVLATPGLALAHEGHAHHHADQAGHQVAHTHKKVAKGDLHATFHFNAPAKAAYTCVMHPEFKTTDPKAKCEICGMHVTRQTHHIAVQLFDAHEKPVQGALVRLSITDAHGMIQGLTLKGDGYYEGDFALMPGKATITAYVKRKADKQPVALSVPYEVK